jgi:hypothetical protein
MKSAVVAVDSGMRLAAALTRAPFLTTLAQEEASVEERGCWAGKSLGAASHREIVPVITRYAE